MRALGASNPSKKATHMAVCAATLWMLIASPATDSIEHINCRFLSEEPLIYLFSVPGNSFSTRGNTVIFEPFNTFLSLKEIG